MKMLKSTLQTVIISVLFLLSTKTTKGQVIVHSSAGYNVNVFVMPLAIVPSTNNCPYGYNYNLTLSYFVAFTGAGAPGSMYTLQGNIACGSQNLFFSLPTSGGIGLVTTSVNPWRPVADCNTATPISLNCLTATLTINGVGIPNQNIAFNLTTVPLAVQLLDFTATSSPGKVKLNWNTATETSNAWFTVERSANATDWEAIYNTPGAGNSSSEKQYEYTDNNPLPGKSYYRLKQTGFDQRAEYSATRTVNSVKAPLSLFPVPNTGNTVYCKGLRPDMSYIVALFDISGRQLNGASVDGNKINLPELRPGLYMMRIHNRQTGEEELLRYVQQ